jgi:hypothetical protein
VADDGPGLSAAEIIERLRGGGAGAGQQASPDPSKPPLWFDEDEDDWTATDLPLRPWIAPRYLMRRTVTMIAGPPGVAKSALVLVWTSSLALGRACGGFVPKSACTSIVYNVEDSRDEQRRRLCATLIQFNAVPMDIKGKITRAGPTTIGTLFEFDRHGTLRPTAAMELLRRRIEEKRPNVIFVDPLVELHNAPENDNTLMRIVAAYFREIAVTFDLAVVIIHHTRKGGADGAGDLDIARGASAIGGAVRIAFTLTDMTTKDAEALGIPPAEARNYARLDNAKSNYARREDAVWFEKVGHLLGGTDNNEETVALHLWKPPEPTVMTDVLLNKLAEDIKTGYRELDGVAAWSPERNKHVRSVRQLLKQHGIKGNDAEKAVLARLVKVHGMDKGTFWYGKNEVSGYFIGGLPALGQEMSPL